MIALATAASVLQMIQLTACVSTITLLFHAIEVWSYLLSACIAAETQCEKTTCEQLCSREGGIDSCDCFIGYELESNMNNCSGILVTTQNFLVNVPVEPLCYIDINECATGSHTCQQQCTNSRGSFSCGCDQGYRLLSDMRSCQGNLCLVAVNSLIAICLISDVNECVEDAQLCNNTLGQICINLAGSFNCSCPVGTEVVSGRCVCTY